MSHAHTMWTIVNHLFRVSVIEPLCSGLLRGERANFSSSPYHDTHWPRCFSDPQKSFTPSKRRPDQREREWVVKKLSLQTLAVSQLFKAKANSKDRISKREVKWPHLSVLATTLMNNRWWPKLHLLLNLLEIEALQRIVRALTVTNMSWHRVNEVDVYTSDKAAWTSGIMMKDLVQFMSSCHTKVGREKSRKLAAATHLTRTFFWDYVKRKAGPSVWSLSSWQFCKWMNFMWWTRSLTVSLADIGYLSSL